MPSMLNEFRSDISDSLIGFTSLQSVFQNISHQLCKFIRSQIRNTLERMLFHSILHNIFKKLHIMLLSYVLSSGQGACK